MMSAFFSAAFSNDARSTFVLPSSRWALSHTTRPPARTLAESACRRASARTFFGKSWAWLRTTGPMARPPPRICGTRAEPWRAPPVPFCLYIFLPVRWMSARPSVLCVPACRLASCQRTMRAIRSARGSSPNTSSLSSSEPAADPSIDVMSYFMASLSLRRFGRWGARAGLGVNAELSGQRRILRQRLLHRVAHRDPTSGVPRHRALDQNEAALGICANDTKVLRRHAISSHMPGHLLVLPGLARILAAAGRPVRTVGDRHAMGGAQAAKVPALHRPGKPLADRHARNVNILPDGEVVGGDLRSDRDHLVLFDAELGEPHLRLDMGDGEAAPLGLRHVLHLGLADAKLKRGIAVLFLGAMRDHLAALDLENGDGHVVPCVREDAGHAQLLCYNA